MDTKQQPEALRLAEMLTADEWPGSVTLVSYARECVAELRRQHARIAELEAELEAVGAGGVSGPLVGRTSLSANAGEPVAYLINWPDEPELGNYFAESPTETGRCRPLYLAAPPTAQAEGWRPIETAPKGELVLLWSEITRGKPFIGDWAEYARYNHPQFTHWSRWDGLPTTTSAGSGKGGGDG